MSQPPTWREAEGDDAASPDGRLTRRSLRRIGDALVYYGIAGLILAAIGIAVLLVATVRLNGVADRIETQADHVVTILDRTAAVLDDAAATVDDVASTVDSADPMIGRVASAITTTVDNLRGLQESAASVSILGAHPLGGLANRFGQVADSLDPIDDELAAFGGNLSSNAAKLRANATSLEALADELHALHDDLSGELIGDTVAAIRFMLLALLAFLAAVAALPAAAALWIGLRIRRDVGAIAAT